MCTHKLSEKQHAKKDAHDSLGLLQFAIRPLHSVLHLSAGQVNTSFCEEIQTELLLQATKFLRQE